MTLMWEVRAAPGRLRDLVAFVSEHADASAQVYFADDADARVVLVDPTERGVPEPPADLVGRPPHQWHFELAQRA